MINTSVNIKKQIKSIRYEERTQDLVIGAIALLTGMFLVMFAGLFLDEYYPNPVTPDDLILDNIDEYEVFVTVGEIAGWLQLVITIGLIVKNNFKRGGEFLFRGGLFYTLRAFAIILNPLAQIQDPVANGSNPILAKFFYKGMFFSGHTGSTFMLYFLNKEKGLWKWIQLALAVTVGISVLLSHSHYSIDVIGGFFAAYFVAHVRLPKFFNHPTN